MNNYPTLHKCLRHMLDHDLASELSVVDVAEATTEFEAWLASKPQDLKLHSAEAELARLSPAQLRKACTTEPGTVKLSWSTDDVLEDISGCIYCPTLTVEAWYGDPCEYAFTLGLLAGLYQSEYEEQGGWGPYHSGFTYFHNEIPGGLYEFSFLEGYMQTRLYGMEAYERTMGLRK